MNIVNIMNFVRGCEPRDPQMDLITPVKEELLLCKKYGYPNTFLMQYDALMRDDMVSLMKEADNNTEVGIWIEMARALTEKVGIKWRGRDGFDWDWYVNPGFLPAYTQSERKALIDEIMRKFKSRFGYYPKSAGSWLIDAYSMEYMQKEYNVSAFCICREQYGVDAYTLGGGYYNQAYYPSKYNNICPAQTKEYQINAPVFRLLGPDPIYNYGLYMYDDGFDSPPTIEPVWDGGRDEKVVRWFFDTYFKNESMSFSYIQLGQENSFGWEEIKLGLPMQLKILKEYVDSGECMVMKMHESGEWFKANFDVTPATSLIADSNVIGKDISDSIWYDCINYRINFVRERNNFYIRDLYKFDEKYKENHYAEPCEAWSLTYDTLPVINGFLWKRNDIDRGGIYFDGNCSEVKTHKENNDLIIDIVLDSEKVKIILNESGITIKTTHKIRFVTKEDIPARFEEHEIRYNHNGYDYVVKIAGECDENGVISPINDKIVMFI